MRAANPDQLPDENVIQIIGYAQNQRKHRAVTCRKSRMFCMGRSGCLDAPAGAGWVVEMLVIVASRGLQDHVGVLNRIAGPDQPDGQRNALLKVRVGLEDQR